MNSRSNKLVSDKQHSMEHSYLEIANTSCAKWLGHNEKKVGEGEDIVWVQTHTIKRN